MPIRLALLDLDGTLKLERDPYIYLHKRLGTWESSKSFFQLGLQGKISYSEWLRRDAELWAGQSVEHVQELFRQSPYVPGAAELLRGLKAGGVQVALVSTGLNLHANLVRDEFDLDHVFANEILTSDGHLSGEAVERVPEGGKGAVADLLLDKLKVKPDSVLAMGDGSSDIALFERAGVSVAVHPSSDRLREAADIVLEEPDLRPLLPMLEQWLG
jgi:phosphoserine phosphatase